MTITDWDSGKSIRKPISVSPYRARSTAPGSDVSVVEILLDTNSPDGGERGRRESNCIQKQVNFRAFEFQQFGCSLLVVQILPPETLDPI